MMPVMVDRRNFIRKSIHAGVGSCLAFNAVGSNSGHHLLGNLQVAATGAASERGGKPDIIFLMTDQQRCDAIGINNPHIKTPNLDRLANEGILYNQAILTSVTMTQKVVTTILSLLLCSFISAQEFHVSSKGNDSNPGTLNLPFKTIAKAAEAAQPGNTVTIHEGVYRERITPPRGGTSETMRIVYRSAKGENVQIKGSEVVKGWVKVAGEVWKVTIPNSFFGNYNPYQDSIYGDWFNAKGRIHHTGEVFLNGKSLYEVESPEKVMNPVPLPNAQDQQGSVYTWYCGSNEKETTIQANFHAYDPNRELVEISVRPTCFHPEKPGINYLTIKGLQFSQAATQWAAPTAEQIGMIATNWSKGWIIEDNTISDSKCSGITLGKEKSTGHNVWLADRSKDGSQHYNEVIFRALEIGWDKSHIGSHLIRNNTIFNCEQTGICGSLGPVFSTVTNNHIYNIWTKRQFKGAEIAGLDGFQPLF
jgi:hypothetical protein